MPAKSRFSFGWGANTTQSQPYTPAERKGEINELKAMLRDPAVEKDVNRRRDVLKKVLAFMTLGVDTSALFTEMILACVTKDLVQKKMVYFYLCANSEGNSDLAILAINTLQKDCRDESPLVRGLALRSLASFRLPQIAEYLVPTLKECLADRAPYVRKTAILATLKLFRVAPDAFRTMGLTDKMYGMLRDNDGVVSTNALAVLSEVLEHEGGVQINKSMLYFLLNRLRDLSEWQQCQVLKLVLKYTPASEDETFDIMNLLEERLRGNNSGVILTCAHVFLHLTQNLPTVHQQVFDRLREPWARSWLRPTTSRRATACCATSSCSWSASPSRSRAHTRTSSVA
jgi:AP-4 complex subunit beta-1